MNLTTVGNGKYRIDSILGQGDFCIAYRGTNQVTGQIVAIRTLDPNLDPDQNIPQLRHQFMAIAKRWSRCQHPNLVGIIDLFDELGFPFLVMTYTPGQSLQEYLKTQPPLPVPQAIHYIRQIALALQVIHQQGLIHCNLQPACIIKPTGSNSVILSGLGVGSHLKPDQLNRYIYNRPLCGGYAALEQYLPNEQPSPATDIYALSALLYYLLTGETPLEAPLCANQLTGELIGVEKPSLRKLHPDLNPDVEEAVRWGLEIQASNRPSNISEWLNILPTPEKALIIREPVVKVPYQNHNRETQTSTRNTPNDNSATSAGYHRQQSSTKYMRRSPVPKWGLFLAFFLTSMISGWLGFAITRSYSQQLATRPSDSYLKSEKEPRLVIDPNSPIFETPALVGENQESDLISDQDLELLGDGSTNLAELIKDVAFQPTTDDDQYLYNGSGGITSRDDYADQAFPESPSSSYWQNYPALEPLPTQNSHDDHTHNRPTEDYGDRIPARRSNQTTIDDFRPSYPLELPELAPVNPDILNNSPLDRDLPTTLPQRQVQDDYDQWLDNQLRESDRPLEDENPKRWDEFVPPRPSQPDWELSQFFTSRPQG